jgi:hypothetical protein
MLGFHWEPSSLRTGPYEENEVVSMGVTPREENRHVSASAEDGKLNSKINRAITVDSDIYGAAHECTFVEKEALVAKERAVWRRIWIGLRLVPGVYPDLLCFCPFRSGSLLL